MGLLSCAGCLLKTLLIIFCILLFLLSLALIAVGVLSLSNDVAKDFVSPGLLFIIVAFGAILLILSIFGCRSSKKAHKCSAAFFMIGIFILVIAFGAVGGAVDSYRQHFVKFLGSDAWAIPDFSSYGVLSSGDHETYDSFENTFKNIFIESKCTGCAIKNKDTGLSIYHSNGVWPLSMSNSNYEFEDYKCALSDADSLLKEVVKTPNDQQEYLDFLVCQQSIRGQDFLNGNIRATSTKSANELISDALISGDSGSIYAAGGPSVLAEIPTVGQLSALDVIQKTSSDDAAIACWCRSNREIFKLMEKGTKLLTMVMFALVGILCGVWVVALFLRFGCLHSNSRVASV